MSRDSMDPFEEFQFKPLTEGLGFHRKSQMGADNSSIASDEFEMMPNNQFKARGLDLIEDERSLDFRAPLSRQKKSLPMDQEALSPTSAAVDEILKTLNQKRPREGQSLKLKQNQDATARSMNQAKATPMIEKSAVSLAAGFLDGMLVVAGTLLGFIILLTVTQVDLMAQLTKSQDNEIYFASFAVFFGVSIVYFLATRIFLGCTPGEWAYDQQLGTKLDQKDLSYGPLVIIRTCINIFTGIIILPLLSQLLGWDLVGKLMGLELHRKV